jgi:GNAT superfamily N-acetyltransferase
MTLITRVVHLPPDVDELVALSLGEQFRALARMRAAWADGSNRFDARGEALFEAREDGRLVGICGLNRDPYTTMPQVGRVRHLYVHPEWRRQGIGRALLRHVLEQAGQAFSRVRLRTLRPDADAFYRALGFAAVDGAPDVTHEIVLK